MMKCMVDEDILNIEKPGEKIHIDDISPRPLLRVVKPSFFDGEVVDKQRGDRSRFRGYTIDTDDGRLHLFRDGITRSGNFIRFESGYDDVVGVCRDICEMVIDRKLEGLDSAYEENDDEITVVSAEGLFLESIDDKETYLERRENILETLRSEIEEVETVEGLKRAVGRFYDEHRAMMDEYCSDPAGLMNE